MCTALALLPMSTRFLLQPTVVSYFFLGLTLYLLTRPERTDKGSHRILWWLPPLFALWVNLDGWFVLGLLAVALYLLGQVLDRQEKWPVLAGVLVVSVAACLLNPYGYKALCLPPELAFGPLAAQLQTDDLFRLLVQSLWQADFFLQKNNLSIAHVAYLPLVTLGIVSFVLNGKGFRLAHVFLWLSFLALSIFRVRTIPFFAIVAGPITALNLQEFALRWFRTEAGATGPALRWALVGRGLSFLAILALVLLAWPGLLHGPQRDFQRVGLAMEMDPSMIQVAKDLKQWRQENKLTGKGLNLSPDVANQLAWLLENPDEAREEGFFDYRVGLFSPEVTQDYLTLRGALLPRSPSEKQEEPAWEKLLQKYNITHVVIYDLDPTSTRRLQLLFRQFFADPNRWALLGFNGHAAVFGVLAPSVRQPPSPFLDRLKAQGLNPRLRRPDQPALARMEYVPSLRALGAPKDSVPLQEAPTWPQRQLWWEWYVHGTGRLPLAADDAQMNLAYFDAALFPWTYEHKLRPIISISAASSVGHAATTAGLVRWGPRVIAGLEANTLPGGVILEGPMAPLILAVHQARQAIQANPNAAASYVRLGQAYYHLRWNTAEASWGKTLATLWAMRQYQMVAAFHHALVLDRDNIEAHEYLVRVYSNRNENNKLKYQDLTRKHLDEWLRCLRAIQQRGGTPEFEKWLSEDIERKEKDLASLQRQVTNAENEFAVQATTLPLLRKVQSALEKGLAEKALQLLLDADLSKLKPLEAQIAAQSQMELLLATGRIQDLHDRLLSLNSEEGEKMGLERYNYYRYLLAAVEGNYAEADQYLNEWSKEVYADGRLLGLVQKQAILGLDFMGIPPRLVKDMEERLQNQFARKADNVIDASVINPLEGLAIGRTILDQTPRPAPVGWLLTDYFLRLAVPPTLWSQMAIPLQQQADICTQRGILALEAGDLEGARLRFGEAGGRDKGYHLNFGGRPAATGYLELIK